MKLVVDANLKRQIRHSNRNLFDKKEAELKKTGALQADKSGLVLTFGNRHTLVKKPKVSRSGWLNEHRWTAFVKLDKENMPHIH
eukprot:CAMPEP_0170506378 /NCGR_PEP_ID=MMETSP0208-20121228/54646_1 /TAXON_ID=197538 /ORGANISM="Strombidium inclinatum, Strain S3" /LENGTH=83 /DNA_ID=CAMNT_0010787855 /DNA_START=683 /DNA_END=934 /DNA_ORIENTATION=-